MTTRDGDWWMTAQEVADEQRIAVSTLYGWRSRDAVGGNHGPRSSKRGGRVLYRRSDVDRWVAESEATSATAAAISTIRTWCNSGM